MAATWFKTLIKLIMGRYFTYYRLIYSCIAAITLLLLLIFQFNHASRQLFKPAWPFVMVCIVFSIIGLSIMIVCIKKYFLNLSGVDVLIKRQRVPVLEQQGLHGYVRHPLYAGTLLFIWSIFFIFPFLNNLIACIIITLYTW